MTIKVTIENGEDSFDVQLEGTLELQNDGIGSYEYWGQKCYDRGEDYYILEETPTWNHSLYSFEQNWIIAIHIFYNFLSIEKQFCDLELSFANDF